MSSPLLEQAADAAIVGGASSAGALVGAALGPGGALLGGALGGGISSGILAARRGGDGWDIAGAVLVGGALGAAGGALGALRVLGVSPTTLAMFRHLSPKLSFNAAKHWVSMAALPGVGAFFLLPKPDAPPSPDAAILPTKLVGIGQFTAPPPMSVYALKMPDQDRGQEEYPPKYHYAKALQTHYEGKLPGIVRALWDSFGDPQRADDVPAEPAANNAPARIGLPYEYALSKDDKSRFAEAYRRMGDELRATYYTFQLIHEQVAKLAQTSRAVSQAGQRAIHKLAEEGINQKAPVIPPGNMSETEWIMKYLDDALQEGGRSLTEARIAQERLSGDTNTKTDQLEQLRAAWQQQLDKLQRGAADPQALRDEFQRQRDKDRQDAEDRRAKAAAEAQKKLEESERRLQEAINRRRTEQESRPPDAGRDRWNDSLAMLLNQLQLQQLRAEQSRVTQALQVPPIPPIPASVLQPPPAPQPLPATPPPAVATPNRALGGLGGLDSLPQLLLQSALANRSGLDAGRNDDRLRDERDALRAERERLREEQERLRESERQRQRNVAPPSPVAAPANPPPPPPPRVDPTGPSAGQPATNAAPAQGGAAERNPDEDGMVLYTFEDGRQQRVLPVVAQALDVALNDNAGTNAQAAYGDTSAKWDDDKEIGKRIDPNQLMTGDVCAFEKGTAITVVWGSADSGGSLEMVVDGKLVPFNPESKEFESLGPFVGFFHPNIGQGAPAGGVKGVAATSPVADDLAGVPA